jgi:ubiquitin-conjugating enzyme E2 S
MIIKSLVRQQNDMLNNYPEGVKIIINPEDYLDIQAEITGPIGTPYEEGIFKIKLVIPSEFPSLPPKGYFLLTKVIL